MRRPGFERPYPAALEQVSATRWRLLTPITYHGARDTFVVPEGFETDFATVPAFATWLVPRYGTYTSCAILHDWCCDIGIREGAISARDADGLFRQALRQAGVPTLRRWLMWAAVRSAAPFTPVRRPGWLADFSRVAAIAVLAAPLVVPPALVVLAAQAVYQLAERALALFRR